MIIIKAFFIKEDDKPNILKKILSYNYIDDNQIIVQPLPEKITEKKVQKIVKNIKKKCQKKGVSYVVLSKKIQNNNLFYNKLYECDINIFDGKWLEKYMVYEILEYITNKKNLKKQETEITLLTNYISNEVVETIKLLSNEYKRINIVTSQINKFKYLENKIYDESGMMITISNNKRKSLQKSIIIINFDFEESLINQYNIYDEAIIVNLQNKARITKKRFNGLTINYYEIYSTRANDDFGLEKIKNYYIKDLLEESIYIKDSFKNIRHNITYKHYKIKELYGINGKLF